MSKKKNTYRKRKTKPCDHDHMTKSGRKKFIINITLFVISLGVPGAFLYDILKAKYIDNNSVKIINNVFTINTKTSMVKEFEVHNVSNKPVYGVMIVVKFDNAKIHTDRIHVKNKAIDWDAKLPEPYGDFAFDAMSFMRQDEDMKVPPLAVVRINKILAGESKPFEVTIDPNKNLAESTNVSIKVLQWNKKPSVEIGNVDSETLKKSINKNDIGIYQMETTELKKLLTPAQWQEFLQYYGYSE